MTLAVIATAMGVGALAMIPALNAGRADRKPRLSASADTPIGTFARDAAAITPDAAAIEQVSSEGSIAAASRPPTPLPTPGAHIPPIADSDREAALDAQLAEILGLLRGRDIAGATQLLRPLAASPWPEPQAARVAQTAALVAAMDVFWGSFNDALDGAPAGRSVEWGGRESVLVEVSQSHVILRSAGQNVQIARRDLPAEAIASLAESLLDLQDPRNQVSLGAFHFVMQGPASGEARRLWHRAAEAGENVSLLLPLLAP
jgi:hypothetical protein